MSRFILIAALNIVFHSAFVQSQYRFRHFDSRDGIGFDDAAHIRQDSLGFIWSCSPRRLSRYDGYSFKIYKSGNLWIVRSPWMAPDRSFSLMRYDNKTDIDPPHFYRKVRP